MISKVAARTLLGASALSAPYALVQSQQQAVHNQPASDAPVLVENVQVVQRAKPSIYDRPSAPVTLTQTTSELEEHIGSARRAVQGVLADAQAKVQGVVDRWIGLEKAVSQKASELHDPTEPLTPAAFYIAVAGLSGSILARNRSILLRLTLPPTLLVLASSQLLPHTTANVGNYLSSLEAAHAPEVHARRLEVQEQVCEALREARRFAKDAGEKVEGSVGKAAREVQGATGLRLGFEEGKGRKVEASEVAIAPPQPEEAKKVEEVRPEEPVRAV